MSDISTALETAARELLAGMSSTYRARNGREMGIQADDGEKCYIVHSDLIHALEAALTTRLAPDRDWRCPECRCHSYANVWGGPGKVRCVNCKHVSTLTPATAPDSFLEMERDLLREALATYADRSKMGTVARPDLQQVIDDAFAWAADKGIRPRGAITADIVREMMPAPVREAIAREALIKARDQFLFYERAHRAKTETGQQFDQPGKARDDTLAKADVNRDMAAEMGRALAILSLMGEG